jgi:NADPH2:quinone reductase
LVLRDVNRKPLKTNQVRIGVYCCGINSIDVSNCAGELEPRPALPFIPGYEVCGEIIDIGEGEESSKFMIGQRVIGLSLNDHGSGFAEELAIDAKDVWPIDAVMSFATGASLVNSYATALLALTRRAEVEEGSTVLITGAAGRLGLASVDLAANVYRCKVIAVCSSDDKSALVRDRGAWATITFGKQNLAAEVKKVTDGLGVSIIIDSVGGDVFNQVIKCVADEGKVIVAGFASKKIPQISGDDLLENSFSVLGVSLEQYRKKKFDVYREVVTDIIEMYEEKLISPLPAIHYPFDQVNEAIAVLKDSATISKLVLDIAP